MTKVKVTVKQGEFPIRYEGERYLAGEEFVIDEKHLLPSMEVLEVLEEVKHDGQVSPFAEMSLEDLKAYAAEHNIDIGKASTEEGIIKKIEEAQQPE